ncbi:MAG: KH domain-containing protein [Clostridia bacterium]|nr:KH domain-containing protein [Clostridia bacterium]
MKELLETIARALVDSPDEVNVTQIDKEDGSIVLELRVAGDDMGKVIGKQGRIAKAIRAVIKSAAIRENKMVSVDIV